MTYTTAISIMIGGNRALPGRDSVLVVEGVILQNGASDLRSYVNIVPIVKFNGFHFSRCSKEEHDNSNSNNNNNNNYKIIYFCLNGVASLHKALTQFGRCKLESISCWLPPWPFEERSCSNLQTVMGFHWTLPCFVLAAIL